MAVPTIVFDLDGTLVDTAPDLAATLDVVLAAEGLPAVPYEQARTMIGTGAKRMIERGIASAGATVTADRLDRLYESFLAHYAEHIADRSRPFPGLVAALDRLAADGYRLAVCTNKLEWLSVRLLRTLGLAHRFTAICGQDTFGVQKPDPAILLKTLECAGGRPEAAILVGDSAMDIRTAQAARIPVIAVDFGYTDVPVAGLNPDRVISSFDRLPQAVAEIFGHLRAGRGPAR